MQLNLFPSMERMRSLGLCLQVAGQQEMARLANWAQTRSWGQFVDLYLVGSRLERKVTADIDLCATRRRGVQFTLSQLERLLVEIRWYSLYRIRINADVFFYSRPEEEIYIRANDGKKNAAWKLRSPYWDKLITQKTHGVRPVGKSVVVIYRALRETNYYYKLPFITWRGKLQRSLRPSRNLKEGYIPTKVPI